MRNSKIKVVLLGVDGTPFHLIHHLASIGIMPYTAALLKDGTFLSMNASIPEISNVSWSSFMTGKNPGKHGIFGFSDLKPRSYSLTFPNFLDLKADTIWDIMGVHNKRSVVLNLPATYPARKIEGLLVSGFVAIHLEKAVFPKTIYSTLRDMEYPLDVDFELIPKGLEAFMDNIFETLKLQDRAFDYFWDAEDWDMFAAIITGTDRLHHYFWDAYEDPTHRFHTRFLEYYKNIDTIIGKYHQRLPDNAVLMIMSDHGFTGIDQEIYLNNILADLGFLTFQSNNRSLENIASSSIAFALDPGRIYINTKQRFPAGSVADEAQYDAVVEDIIRSLSDYSIPELNNLKPFEKIYKANEIYSGAYVSDGPDLVLQSKHRFDLKGTLSETSIFGRRMFTGMHTYADSFFYINRNIHVEQTPTIMDIAPSILTIMNLNIPDDFDGISLIAQ